MKYKIALPFIAVTITVFFAVWLSVMCHNVFDAKSSVLEKKTEVSDFMQKNIFVSVRNSSTDTLDTNFIVSLDPKDKSITLIKIPADTRVEIASSNQLFKDVMNIGGIEMLREQLEKIIPLPVDYHLIIKTDDLYSENGNYSEIVEYVFNSYLWQVEDLEQYLNQMLSLSNTDLTLMRTEDYAEFLMNFATHTTSTLQIPGERNEIGDKIFFDVDINGLNEIINNINRSNVN